MSGPAITFLTGFAQSLATMKLYSPGHPARGRAVDGSFHQLQALLETEPRPTFSFLDERVIYREHPLHEMQRWPWSCRLAAAGIQRMEFDRSLSRDDYAGFLDEVLLRLTSGDVEPGRAPGERLSVRFGQVGVREGDEVVEGEGIPDVRLKYTLDEERQVMQYLRERAQQDGTLSSGEVETVVRSLAVAMHGDGQLMAPLCALREHDDYATIHALNTAVLAMTFGESMGLSDVRVHELGSAALLHDIGMTRMPAEVMGSNSLTSEQRARVEEHALLGARMILQNGELPALAAVVAYEHHMRPDGTGYPRLAQARACHQASQVVAVCSTYDALRMARPYRPAWQMPKILEYIYEGAGTVFDREAAWDFVAMMQRLEGRVVSLET